MLKKALKFIFGSAQTHANPEPKIRSIGPRARVVTLARTETRETSEIERLARLRALARQHQAALAEIDDREIRTDEDRFIAAHHTGQLEGVVREWCRIWGYDVDSRPGEILVDALLCGRSLGAALERVIQIKAEQYRRGADCV